MIARARLVCAIAIAAAACSSPRRNLQAVTLPDLARLDASVQAQVRERYQRMAHAVDDRSTPVDALAAAYGELAMVLQAAEYLDAAEPAYLNAETLSPRDVRWPYYLANLYKSRGETDKAEAAFKRALQLQPDDLATLIWLARLNLDQGKTGEAEALFEKANALAPNTVAVVAGLGRAAVAKRDYAGAVRYLEQALAIDPSAEALHAPLAAAYRGLGQIDKAKPHIGQWQNKDLPVPDPRQQQMDLVLESGLSYELRGISAFESHDWKSAADLFQRGLSLTPADSPLHRSLQHKLGTALALQGDNAGAERQFGAVVDAHVQGVDEATAKAHYSLGVMMVSDGREAQALPHLQAAIVSQPSYVEAHLALADFLRRHQQTGAALEQYRATLALNPRLPVARLGYAMCLHDLKRDRETRAWLEEAVKDAPDQPEYKIALARVLASSPDAAVRDGQKALDLAQELFKAPQHTTALGETIAMALAEYGDFAQAISIQRDVIVAARRSGLTTQLPQMQQNLSLYERHQPCRTPWRDEDLVISSTSPASPN